MLNLFILRFNNFYVNKIWPLQPCAYAYGDKPNAKRSNTVLLHNYRFLLGVSENYSYEELKNAFLEKAKKYHPDSSSDTADQTKFAEVEEAYRALKQNLTGSDSTQDVYDTLEKDFGIKHTVPQHRQYLNNSGYGYGTPSQRQKQYEQQRISTAMEHVHDYQLKKQAANSEKTLVQRDAALAMQFKSRQAIERLVEDLILESMKKGVFDNLPGSGKPLKYVPENPYVDSMTHKLNQILINNGFTTEWIVMEKEIGELKEEMLRKLTVKRAEYGPYPLIGNEEIRWQETVNHLHLECKKLNTMIDKFNMIVPISKKQKIHFQLEKEANRIIQQKPIELQKLPTKKQSQKSSEVSLLDIVFNIFNAK